MFTGITLQYEYEENISSGSWQNGRKPLSQSDCSSNANIGQIFWYTNHFLRSPKMKLHSDYEKNN